MEGPGGLHGGQSLWGEQKAVFRCLDKRICDQIPEGGGRNMNSESDRRVQILALPPPSYVTFSRSLYPSEPVFSMYSGDANPSLQGHCEK